MVRKGLVFGILFALMFFMLGVVSAATVNVNGTDVLGCSDVIGTPYCTIQSAINAAGATDVIEVAEGTYTENIVVDKSLTLTGASSDSVTVTALVSNVHAFTITSSNVDISGFTITGASVDTTAGIYLAAGVENCNISNNNLTGNGDGIWLEIGANYNTIINNYASNNHQGIELHGADYNTLTNNIANSNTDYNQGFKLEHADHNTFTNNTANFNKQYGFYLVATDGGCNYNTFINNTASYNIQRDGFRIRESHDNTFMGNTANSNTRAGIMLEGNSSYSILTGNNFINNSIGLQVRKDTLNNSDATTLTISENTFRNINLGILYDDSGITVNAENNYWGHCSGPYNETTNPSGLGDTVSGNVDFTPWIGACPGGSVTVPTCMFDETDVTLYTTATGSCISSVLFGINNGTWKNYTGVALISPLGNYAYTLSNALTTGGQSIQWTVFVSDCSNHTSQDLVRTFYVNRRTSVSINPLAPNGLAGWYITEPQFTLSNLDLGANSIWYRWDGSGEIVYAAPFGLENIPNPPRPESAGTLSLKWWSTICSNESLQNQTFKIDMIAPQFNTYTPENMGNTENNQRPTISVYIDELYGTNSGIKLSSVALAVDGVNVSASVSLADGLDATATYTPAANLALGWHTASIYAEDNAGHSNSTTWMFNLTLEATFTTLDVVSPLDDSYYAGRAVPITVLVDGLVDLSYIDYFESTPRWKTLCRDCMNYSGTKNFNDGVFDEVLGMADSWHNITIRAVDRNGNLMEENRYFFVDSKLPRVSKLLPGREKIVNGSYFYIKYHEDNLRNITLRYGNLLLGYGGKNLTGCSAGRNQECSTSVNLAGYENQSIEYWYDVADVARTISSKRTSIRVDTVSPVMTIYNPNNASYGRYVYFNVTMSENVKSLEYYDQSESVPKWKRLCTNCNSYGFSKVAKKTFARGSHNLIIRASDYAGNTDEELRSFSVSY